MGLTTKGRHFRRIFKDGCNRTTISIPLAVKKRMNKFQKRNAVNWSLVATRAFKAYMKAKDGEE